MTASKIVLIYLSAIDDFLKQTYYGKEMHLLSDMNLLYTGDSKSNTLPNFEDLPDSSESTLFAKRDRNTIVFGNYYLSPSIFTIDPLKFILSNQRGESIISYLSY